MKGKNCQPRSIAHQLFGSDDVCTPSYAAHVGEEDLATPPHAYVRREIVKELIEHANIFRDFAGDGLNEIIGNFLVDGAWGCNFTLQAAAALFSVRIIVVSHFDENLFDELLPLRGQIANTICVAYSGNCGCEHYDSTRLSR